MKDSTAVEKWMVELGAEKYRANAARDRAAGAATRVQSVRRLLQEAVAKVGAEIAADLGLQVTRSKSRPRPITPYLIVLHDWEHCAAVALRILLDQLGHGMPYARCAKAIGWALQQEALVLAFKEQNPEDWSRVAFWCKKKGPEVLSRALRRARARERVAFAPWPYEIRVAAGIYLLEAIREHTGIVEFRTTRKAKNKKLVEIIPTDKLLQWLEQADEQYAQLMPVYLPIKVPPKEWDSPTGGGYHSEHIANKVLVKARWMDQRERADYGDMPEVYDAVNAAQNTGWRINTPVLEVLRELWLSGSQVANLPAREDEVPPPFPGKEADPAVKKAWAAMSRAIHDQNRQQRTHRMRVSRLLWIAKEYEEGPLWFPYYLDFRGRLYPRPIFLQPQGDDMARGLLTFRDGKPITDWEQAKWLAVHLSNCWGYDKVAFSDRIEWATSNEARIIESAMRPLDYRWWTEADCPWQFLAACMEWAAFKKHGYGYVTTLPIYMDGSNNGLQVFSFLLRDPVGGAATNCTPGGLPRDIYQDVADAAYQELMRLSEGEESPRRALAKDWIHYLRAEGKLPRQATKRPVMVLPYGGTRFSTVEYVSEWYEEDRRKRQEPHWLDMGLHVRFLGGVIWDAIGKVVTSAQRAMKFLQQCASVMTKQKLPLRWTTPCGFEVVQAYHQAKKAYVQVRYTRTFVRRLSYRRFADRLDSREQRQGVSPNFVHSLDGAVMVKTVNRCRENGVTSISPIHDSFGVVAADIPILNKAVREVYAEVFSGNLLEDFRSQLAAYAVDPSKLPDVPAQGDMDPRAVLDSPYFFA